MEFKCLGYLVFLFASASCQLVPIFQHQACEITITVDKNTSHYSDWRMLYSTYNLNRSNNSSLNLISSDLQEVLQGLNSTIFHRANDCIEVIISRGRHLILQSVYLTQNVRIAGDLEEPGEVFVDFNSISLPQDDNFYNAITFFGSDYIEIRDISFQKSPGLVFIERVTQAHVINSNFE